MLAGFGICLALAALQGCSSTPSHVQSADDVIASMRAELTHTVDSSEEPIAWMRDELAHAVDTAPAPEPVGTTMLTSATFVVAPTPEPASMPLPVSRMSVAATLDGNAEAEPAPVLAEIVLGEEPVLVTWGGRD